MMLNWAFIDSSSRISDKTLEIKWAVSNTLVMAQTSAENVLGTNGRIVFARGQD